MSVRIGFIGAGGIAGRHMETLVNNPDAEMVAFSDPDVDRARAAAKTYGGKAFKSYRTMLNKTELDAVFICIPPFAHTDQVKLAVEGGLAVFTEKPIGLNLRKVKDNTALIEEKGVVSCVGYQWRYLDSTQKARELLAGRKIAVASGYWVGGTPGVWWWRQMKTSGGQAVEQTTHIFDVARYLVGEVDTIFASGTRGSVSEDEMPNYDVHDASVVQMRYGSGTVGNVTSSCILSQGVGVQFRAYARDLSVIITNGQIEISTPGKTKILKDMSNPTATMHQAFLAAVQGKEGPPILSSYADAMESLKITLAANRSMDNGRAIKLSSM
jgi:predicted dehydrogenase